MLAYIFLVRNRYRLTASEAVSTRAVLDLAAGAVTEDGFAHWLEDNIERA